MNTIELIQDIGKIVVFLMILLSVFLVTAKSTKKMSNSLFAAFLLVTAIDFTGLFLPPFSNNIFNSLKFASVLLQMPLYYLYVRSACYFNFKLEAKELIHAFPALGIVILLLITDISDGSFFAFNVISKIQYYAYILAVLFTLSQFKKVFQENYAESHNNTYKWLFQTTILFLIGNSFVFIRHLISSESNNGWLTGINVLISIFALIVICWFVLKALYQPSLFLGIDKNLTPLKPIKKIDLESEESLKRLSDYMDTQKPYLDPELSLQKLALGINLPEKQLSQLINQHIGKHFFDYINEFRISDAKVYLREQKDLTVLEILYTVGFNSKSSFYTAFKKETSQTPTAYRKSMQ